MSSYATFEPVRKTANSSFLPVPEEITEFNAEDANPVVENIRALKRKYLPSLKTENLRHLPTIQQKKDTNAVNANLFFADKYPLLYSLEYYEEALQKLKFISLGLAGFLVLVFLSWAAFGQANFVQGDVFVYNSGVIGGLLLLVATKHSVFNRFRLLRLPVSSDDWHFIHIVCGILGAYFMILHSSFNLTTSSGSFALIATISMIISGALGRYLVTLSTTSLHKQYAKIKEVEHTIINAMGKYQCLTADRISKRLSRFVAHCFEQPKSTSQYFVRCLSIAYYGVYYYVLSVRELKIIIGGISVLANLEEQEVTYLIKKHKVDLRNYVLLILQMGYTSLIEHALRHWRILHKTMLYLVAITAIVHVWLVHV